MPRYLALFALRHTCQNRVPLFRLHLFISSTMFRWLELSFHRSESQEQQPSAFTRFPPELLRLIAEHTTDSQQYKRASLCSVNKSCNAACTPSLYSNSIYITKELVLDRFSDTILSYRPDLAMLVKHLCLKADRGWDRNEW